MIYLIFEVLIFSYPHSNKRQLQSMETLLRECQLDKSPAFQKCLNIL